MTAANPVALPVHDAAAKTVRCQIDRRDGRVYITRPAVGARPAASIVCDADQVRRLAPAAWPKVTARPAPLEATLTYADLAALRTLALPAAPAPAANGAAPPAPTPAPAEAPRTATATARTRKMAARAAAAQAKGASRVERLDDAVKLMNEPLYAVTYDIPKHLNDECPNPSDVLWKYGFRFNKSCWILPKRSVESPAVQALFARWDKFPRTGMVRIDGQLVPNGVEYHVLKQDAETYATYRRIARERLREEMQRCQTVLMEGISAAEQRYRDAVAEIEACEAPAPAALETAAQRRDNRTRNVIENAGKALDNLVACLRTFDETEAVADLTAAMRAAIAAQAAAFNAHARAAHIRMARLPRS
jgi:hypothetical protein